MIEKFFQTLTEHIQKQTPDLNTGETILEFLYECYSEHNNLEDAQIVNANIYLSHILGK